MVVRKNGKSDSTVGFGPKDGRKEGFDGQKDEL